MEIKTEKKNNLFNRKEVQGVLESESSPSYAEVKSLLGKKYSVPEEAVKILRIKGRFGTNKFEITANIYGSPEEKERIESKKKKDEEWKKKKEEDKNKSEEDKKEESKENNKEETDKESEENKEKSEISKSSSLPEESQTKEESKDTDKKEE